MVNWSGARALLPLGMLIALANNPCVGASFLDSLWTPDFETFGHGMGGDQPFQPVVHIAAPPVVKSGNGVHLARPVVVNAGPAVDVDFGRGGFPGFPFEELFEMGPLRDDPFEKLLPNLFDMSPLRDDPFEKLLQRLSTPSDTDAVGGPKARPAVAGGFQVEKASGHFNLRASLPGYKFHRKGEKEGDQPLCVEVIGQSLIVRGRQTEESMVRSFQRSFRLPLTADTEAINVTYNVSDGSLAVDIPARKDNMSEGRDDSMESWEFDSQDGGSQTTITFLSEGGGDLPAQLWHPEKEGGIFSIMEAMMRSGDPRPEQKPTGFLASHHKPLPAKPSQQAPMLLQSEDTKPFWRLQHGGLMEDGPAIEIVAPQNVDIGKPEGNRVPVYHGKAESGQAREPVSHLDLPVVMGNKDCTWAAPTHERVLRCKVQPDAVKSVPVHVVEL